MVAEAGRCALAVMVAAAVAGVLATSSASAATVSCSKAEATAVVKRLGLSDVSVTHPVYKVFCGAFTGAGGQAMVAAINGSGNVGMLYWAVFRWSGHEWQLLMKQRQASVLAPAGSDIRETVSSYRDGDPRCCPSGGSKARLWHWNGTRFTAGPWKQAAPAGATTQSALPSGYIKTPSGNIVCVYWLGTKPPAIGCRMKSGLKPKPATDRPGCRRTEDVTLRATGRPTIGGRSICPGEDEGDAGPLAHEAVARILPYGKTWSGGSLRCSSASTGLTCTNTSGHGFFLSRESWRAF